MVLFALWMFNQPGLSRAAGPPLRLAFEPLVGEVNRPVAPVVKNFSWSDMALVRVTAFNSATGQSENVGADEPLAVGPRRRADLSFTPQRPGLWTIRAQGSWLSGGGAFTEAVLPVGSAGSTSGELTIGQTVEGVVRPDDSGVSWGTWALRAEAGDSMLAELDWDRNRASSARLQMVDPSGNFLAQDEELILITAAQEGVYYIYVLSSNEEVPYTLRLSEGPSGDSEGGAFTYDSAVTGLIEPNDDTDSWIFIGAPGEVAIITMRAPANSSLNSELSLYDANGFQLATSDDFGIGRDASLSYVIPTTGEYRVEARGHNGASGGVYRLRLAGGTCADAGICLGSSPVQGFVAEGGAQGWQFQGVGGQEVTIEVTAFDQGFDPLLILYGPDGSEIGSDDDGGSNLDPLLTVTLPNDGFYTATVTSYDGSSGRYAIRLSRQNRSSSQPSSSTDTLATTSMTPAESTTTIVERTDDIAPTSVFEGRTATDAYLTAKSRAMTWKEDAMLYSASATWSQGADQQEMLGGVTGWGFTFYSSVASSIALFSVVGDEATLVTEGNVAQQQQPLNASEWKLDSQDALQRFLEEGGTSFMEAEGVIILTMLLTSNSESSGIEWRVSLFATQTQKTLTMRIDATSGVILDVQQT
jgi:hypothetical protein